MKIYLFYIPCIILLFTFSLNSCKKKVNFGQWNITLSRDTLVFDTVFTTIGSATKQFKIYNRQSNSLRIEEIELKGWEDSPFRLNIDGSPGYLFKDLSILSNDSLFAFIDVQLEVNNQTNPMVIEDRIRFLSLIHISEPTRPY